MLKKILISVGVVILLVATTILGFFADKLFKKYHECNFSTKYSYDSEYHWFDCNEKLCDKVKDKEAHIDEDGNDICDKCNYGASALVNGVNYETLQAAVDSADNVEITLYKDLTCAGFKAFEGKTITIDLNNHTYSPNLSVGSNGTETNGLQLLKGSTVIIKNGIIKATTANKILIQNYSNLTLENVILDGRELNGSGRYVLSNNFGNITIKGNTQIIAKDGDYAFDLYYGMSSSYDDGITVTFDETFTGKVIGIIEYGPAGRAIGGNWLSKTVLDIRHGNFSKASFKLNNCTSDNANIILAEGKTLVEDNCLYKII